MTPPRQAREPDRERVQGRRRSTGVSGRDGEALAAELLRCRGYRIEAQNLRTRRGEIDLLVRRRRTWVAVEVKARADHPAPERCVTQAQLDRIEAALRLLQEELRPRPRQLRIDVVTVRWSNASGAGAPTADVDHFEGFRILSP